MDERRRRRRGGDPIRREERTRTEHSSGVGASETGSEVAHELRERVEEVTRETGNELRSAVESRKEQAADTMERVARAMRRTADSLEEEDAEGLADYPERVAEQVDRVSDYLRRHDLGDVISDTEAFARRRPELFFGGLALAGMAAGRFLRSSSTSNRERHRALGDPAYGTTARAPRHGPLPPEHESPTYPHTTPGSPGARRPDEPTGGRHGPA